MRTEYLWLETNRCGFLLRLYAWLLLHIPQSNIVHWSVLVSNMLVFGTFQTPTRECYFLENPRMLQSGLAPTFTMLISSISFLPPESPDPEFSMTTEYDLDSSGHFFSRTNSCAKIPSMESLLSLSMQSSRSPFCHALITSPTGLPQCSMWTGFFTNEPLLTISCMSCCLKYTPRCSSGTPGGLQQP